MVCFVGVADGVGGWRDYGVDPSKFPKYLMSTCEQLVQAGTFTPHEPTQILIHSYNEIQEKKEPLIGKYTDCLRVCKRLFLYYFILLKYLEVCCQL